MNLAKAALLAMALGLAVPQASAVTFTVNNLSDLNDAAPGNGVCDVGNGSCSLRAAVDEANSLAGADIIVLATGVHVISQTHSPGGVAQGRMLQILDPVEIVGAGQGQSIVRATSALFEKIFETYSDRSPILLRDFTLDAQTGRTALNDINPVCPTCVLELQRIEVLSTISQPNNFIPVLRLGGLTQVSLREVSVRVTGSAGNFLYGIYSSNGGALLLEDSLIDGGNSLSTGLLYSLRRTDSALQIRRSRLTRIANTSSTSSAVFLFNSGGASAPEVVVEDSEFDLVARGLVLGNYGFSQNLRVERCLFSAVGAEGLGVSGPGSGVVRNSTFSTAVTGVGLLAPSSGVGTFALALDSVTVAGGTTSVAVGSGLGSISARNSILAYASGAACSGTLDSLGYNLIQGVCSVTGTTTGNQIGVDPLLAGLADNGGPTRTRALQVGSPAIDTADTASCPPRDQREFGRPVDGDGNTVADCDIGAYEFGAVESTNQSPQATDDQFSWLEDASGDFSVHDNDLDPDGNLDPTTTNTDCPACSLPAHHALSNLGDGRFEFTAEPHYFGPDAFVYQICDTEGACDTATVSISVTPVNDPPSFTPGPALVFSAGSSGTQLAPDWVMDVDFGPGEAAQSVLAYIVTPMGDPAAVVAGLPTIDPAGNLALTLTGNPGLAEFEVVVRDDGGTAMGGMDLSPARMLRVSVGAAADLAVVIQRCVKQVGPGQDYFYALRVDHRGGDPALDVTIEASLPPTSPQVQVFNPDCVAQAQSVICHIEKLAAAGSVPVALRIVLPGTAQATFTLGATVHASTDDPVASNNSASASVELVPTLVYVDAFESCAGAPD